MFNTPLACLACVQARGSDLRVHFKNTREAAHSLRGMDLVSVAANKEPAAVACSRRRGAGSWSRPAADCDPSAALLSLHSSVVAGMCHGCWVVQMSLPAERQADAADSYCRCLPARPCLQAKAKAYMQAVMEHKRCVPFLRYNGEHRWATAALAWLLSWCLHAAPCNATAAVPAMPAAVPATRQTTFFAGAA